MLGDAEIKYAINGLLSLTPDAMPCLGETTEVRNLWSAAAVWVKEGPGMAQVVAEWMTYGYPRVIDPHAADIARFYTDEKSDEHIWARAEEHFNKTYGIVHPSEQWESRRGLQESAVKAIARTPLAPSSSPPGCGNARSGTAATLICSRRTA